MVSPSRRPRVTAGSVTVLSTMLLAAGLLAAGVLRAQVGATAPTLKFEVATVKPNDSLGGGAYVQAIPGRLVMTNFSLRTLILFAYGVQGYQILGEPSWTASDNYDIQAKAEGNPSVNQMEGPMLQALLEDRFKLMVHHETRQMPVFELTVAKGGVKLQPTREGSCTPYAPGSPPPPAAAPGARTIFCGYPRSGVDGLNRTLEGAGVSMKALASNLSRLELHKSVIDRTGLTGTFDVHLKWAVDAPTGPAAGPGVSDNPAVAAPDNSTGPSIYSALQDQMGLKLSSTRGPVEVLVIDHIEKPSGN
jgi:uncharacterized protein (TIGR03435 family)